MGGTGKAQNAAHTLVECTPQAEGLLSSVLKCLCWTLASPGPILCRESAVLIGTAPETSDRSR